MNYYNLLKVHKNASKKIIKDAYMSQVKKYHPDLFQNKGEKEWAESKMKKINSAYDILMDDVKRLEYDKIIEEKYYPDLKDVKKKHSKTDYERLISFISALFNVFILLFVDLRVFFQSIGIMVLLLACIWYGDEMGSYLGVFISRTSPGIIVKILAWIILAGITIAIFIGCVITLFSGELI
ncbi:DnaJ domain-containing protein [Herbivorax sp. ANBcel31]|uniref:J domain-containing protein n=1 Tax=Herbivorax sp. ANBcel31 TaxID=3069754 RepID=UPI0027B4615D|nr:DnaJ domain-containing protein [Herbivorax sp. ANBcel31]MDQ2086769.1 DnaJ domain-containing protein [Herbivorax sp. ANBcel31]